LLEYPSDWREVTGAGAVPGLALASPVVFTRGGRTADSGLLVGSLPAGEPGTLPRSFVRALSALPATAVVNLSELQAYRYVGARVPSFGGALVLYAIPVPNSVVT